MGVFFHNAACLVCILVCLLVCFSVCLLLCYLFRLTHFALAAFAIFIHGCSYCVSVCVCIIISVCICVSICDALTCNCVVVYVCVCVCVYIIFIEYLDISKGVQNPTQESQETRSRERNH